MSSGNASGAFGVSTWKTSFRSRSLALDLPMDAFFDAERGEVLTMARAGEAPDEALQTMTDAGLELLADIEFAEELASAHGW